MGSTNVLTEERALIARAQSQDRAALRTLLEAQQRPVHALVSRMLAGRAAAVDDLAQETLIKMLKALPRFDLQGPAKFSTWVLTIATRVCLDHLRSVRRASLFVVANVAAEAFDGEDLERRAIARETTRAVEIAMADLPDDQRVVLILRAYHDLDYDEIAAILSVEVGTVKSRLSRARMALKNVMARGEK